MTSVRRPSSFLEWTSLLALRCSLPSLAYNSEPDFEMFESLELLALGIQGKLCLWKALQTASKRDSRLREYGFNELISRAQQQYDTVENQRLNLAQAIF